jgi:hypothetical protein
LAVTLGPGVRKLALTAHVACSVGWLGAVVGFLGPAIVVLASEDLDRVRGAYVMMELTASFVLVPLALLSLATGLVQSLGTPWGLFRHYWVVFKLGINVAATLLLLAYVQTLASFADLAERTQGAADVGALKSPSPLLHAVAALVLLLVATVLGVYKPRGLTPYGQRRRRRAA